MSNLDRIESSSSQKMEKATKCPPNSTCPAVLQSLWKSEMSLSRSQILWLKNPLCLEAKVERAKVTDKESCGELTVFPTQSQHG